MRARSWNTSVGSKRAGREAVAAGAADEDAANEVARFQREAVSQ
jgi:hypothetical protein